MMVIGKLLDTLSNWLDLYSGHLYMATVVKVFHILSCQMSISRGQSHWHSLVRLPGSSSDCQLGDPSGALDLSRRKKNLYGLFISFLPALWDHHSPFIPLPPYSHVDDCL